MTRWKRFSAIFITATRGSHSAISTPDELHLFASRLANRHITWQELSKPWKAVLRRRRKQQEAESLRIELVAADAPEGDT